MKNKVLLFATAMLITHAAWAITPENGWWWNPSEPGRGFNIETQQGTVFIATFVYDDGGSPIWYSGTRELRNNAVTATLMRSDGGQCIGCAYTAPISSDGAGPVTVKFTSETNGTLTWQGRIVPIERFNFALGKGLDRLLGEWVITIGSPSFPIYFGERLTYQEVRTDDGGRLVAGSRSGSPGNPSIVSAFEDPQATGYQYFGMTDSSTSYYAYYMYNFAGLNKIIGKTTTIEKTASSEEVARSLADGFFFVGYRNLDKTEVAAHRVTAQSLRQPKDDADDADREAVNVLLPSLQDPRSTTPEEPGKIDNAAIEMISSKVYMLENRLIN